MDHVVKILSIDQVTHDVRRFRFEKPRSYNFTPGQATDVSINIPGWENELRPFTFTCLTKESWLEFTIKIYEDHKGVTNEIGKLKVGEELIIRDVWGAIEYKGPGYFIAGGAGITPFLAILRFLQKENKLEGNTLFFSNKTSKDIIVEKELTAMLGKNVIYLLTKENNNQYHHGPIDERFLKSNIPDFKKHFYVCGPPKMIEDINTILTKLGASPDTVVFEK
jgi:ferredoxin-NADP reductase